MCSSDLARGRFERVEKPVGRVRFNAGTWAELPVVDGAPKTHYARHEFHLLPPAVRELVEEIMPLWRAEVGAELGGVNIDRFRGDDHLTWWIDGAYLAGNLPPMYSTTNRLTRAHGPRNFARLNQEYRYHTASLLKVAERLRGGRPVFAYPEAIDRLLAEV